MSRPSRAPYVAVRTDVVKDESFAMLADVAGYNRHEALGRMVALWSFCRDRGLEDAPADCKGYAVSEALVRRFLGTRGVEAILGDGCDELALGERWGEGLIYLRGTSETVEALRGMRRSAEAGGRARAAHGVRDGGRFTDTESVSQSNNHQPSTSRDVPVDQPTSTRAPAVTSVPPSSFLLSSPSEKNSEPKARRPPGASAQVIAHWNTRFEGANGSRPLWTPSLQRLVDRLTKQFAPDEIKRRIDTAFDAPPKWPEGPYDFETFARHFDKFIRKQSAAQTAGGVRSILSREQRERLAREQHESDHDREGESA